MARMRGVLMIRLQRASALVSAAAIPRRLSLISIKRNEGPSTAFP
jgi:hypothetical protein